MSDWTFRVLDITPATYAAAPALTARLRISERTGVQVHAIALRCQVRIEPQRRGYDGEEGEGLRALFGDRDRWSETLKPFLWMQCNTTVQGFTGDTDADLELPCTYDFDVTGSRFLHGVKSGSVPLNLLFSGTVFTRGEHGFGVLQVPWDCEARYDMPISVWQEMLAKFFPYQGWLRLHHDVLASLGDFRARHGLVSWEETVKTLLARAAADSTRARDGMPQ
ncbi:MAG: hypothetical protein JWR85_2374 [Marmoricola sp.]|nr:hypothetical protein [Marmoricola sp.]